MKRRTWFKLIALSVAPILLVAAEFVIRGMYGPALFFERYQPGYVLERYGILDEGLFRRFRPGIEVNFNLIYPQVDCPIIINELGLRGPEVTPAKPAGTFRVACLGDSCTFGWLVQEDETYPQQLERSLRERHPGRSFEVLNFGSPGYTAHQGAVLMNGEVPSFAPDVVVVGFGYNDFVAGDATIDQQAESYHAYFERNPPLQRTLNGVLGELALYRYLRYQLGLPVHDAPGAAGDGQLVWQVGPDHYRELLEQIVARARAIGAGVVLVNSDLPNPRALRVLRPFAARERLPLIDLRGILLERCGGGIARDAPKSATGVLPPAGSSGRCNVRFRVFAPQNQNDLHLLADRLNPDGGPQATRLRDDGTGGDQQAGDGVYSCTIELAPVEQWGFAFVAGPPPLTDLRKYDANFFHSIDVPADASSLDLPVYRFGNPMTEMLVAHDAIHPNAAGQRLWAAAVGEEIETSAEFAASGR